MEVSDKKSRECHQILFSFEVNIDLRECGLYIPRWFQIWPALQSYRIDILNRTTVCPPLVLSKKTILSEFPKKTWQTALLKISLNHICCSISGRVQLFSKSNTEWCGCDVILHHFPYFWKNINRTQINCVL